MHLVDVTMFWSDQGGGVKRYLAAKSSYFANSTAIRNTVVVPGSFLAEPPDIPGFPLPFSAGYRLPRSKRSVLKVLDNLAPDLIEVGDPYQVAWAALEAGQERSIPVVAFYHSDIVELAQRTVGNWGARLASRYVANLYGKFDLVLAPSRHTARRLESLGVTRVKQQPLGVDTALFHPGRRDAQWRRDLGLTDAHRVLLYVGRYAPEKNLDILCAAVALLGEPYVLVMIGGGTTAPSGPQVLALPYESNPAGLASAYASADIFVHAGDQETFGLGVLESMASGVPVVGCGRGGIGELIDDSVGRRVDRCAAADFAEAIRSLWDERGEAIASRARARAMGYDWKPVMESLEGIYLSLVRPAVRIAA